jgi:type IV pilus assembly protein PilM
LEVLLILKKDKNKITMFELFSSKKNHFVGIDFGTSYIKIVELSYHDQKAYLENYGVVDLAMITQTNDGKTLPYEERMIGCLKELVKSMEMDVKNVMVSIPGFTGLVTLVEFPEMKDDEIDKAIQYEAHKYIPTSLDEIVMSWEVVGKRTESPSPMLSGATANKKVQVLLVAAPKKEISKYEHLVNGAGLEVKAIELETFSIARSLVGDDGGNYLIVDIGARATNIILVEKGIVRVNRNVDAGGNEITNTIADSMSISKQRAEILKKGEKDLVNGRESIVIPVLELIAGESLRILNSYKEKNRDVKIDQVIISGGTSRMKGVTEYFTNTIGITSIAGNPWRRIGYEAELSKMIEDIGSSFSVAIGLALRGIDEYKRK